MKKYLSLLLLGSMVQFATVDAGCCKDGCVKHKIVKHPRGCKNKDKKADKKEHKKNSDKKS